MPQVNDFSWISVVLLHNTFLFGMIMFHLFFYLASLSYKIPFFQAWSFIRRYIIL